MPFGPVSTRGRIWATAAAAILLVGTGAGAMAQWSPTAELGKVQGGRFVLDKSHARIVFSTTHFGISTYYSFFNDFDAALTINAKEPAKSTLTATVNLSGVVASDQKFEERLKSPDFFDVGQFPTAAYKATKIEMTGDAVARITGDLSLHGVTKPVVLAATFNGGGDNPLTNTYVVGFNATGVLNRSDFEMKTFLPLVGDQITLTISCEFNREK